MIEINSSLSFEPKELIWAEGHINYTLFHFKNQRSEMHPITLKNVEAKLEDFPFYRIHRKILINLRFIEKTDKDCNEVILKGVALPISRRRKGKFREVFSNEC